MLVAGIIVPLGDAGIRQGPQIGGILRDIDFIPDFEHGFRKPQAPEFDGNVTHDTVSIFAICRPSSGIP